MSTAINCVVNQDMILDEIYPKIHLSMPLAYDNAFAHAMRITAFDRDKNPADLTGVGVVGNFKRSNDTTVTPILGTVTGNVGEILLPPSCYVVPGRFTFTMNLTQLTDPEGVDAFDATVDYEKGDLVVYDGVVWRFTADHDAGAWTGSDAVLDGITRSAMWVEGHIDKNISENIVDPGTPVGNIEQAIGNATAAATAAQSAATEASQAAAAAEQTVTNFAPAFDASVANAAGDYVTYTDGKLYLLPDGHTAGTSWANTTHTETDFGAEVSDLKSATDTYEKNVIGINDNAVNATWTEGYTINAIGDPTQMNGMHYSSLLPVYGNTTRLIINARATSARSRFHGYDGNGKWLKELHNLVLSSGVNDMAFDSTGVVYIRLATQDVNEVIFCGNAQALTSILNGSLQGSALNITSETRATICESDLDNAPLNRVFVIVPDNGLAHKPPTNQMGLFIALSKQQTTNNGITQVYFAKDNAIYIRNYYSGAWGEWYNPQNKTFYVSTSGNDNNLGTSSAPFATITKALQVGGKTIYVKPGTYTENVSLNNLDGITIAPYDIPSYDASTPDTPMIILDGGEGLTISHGLTITDCANISISNVYCKNTSSYPIYIKNASGLHMKYCKASDSLNAGFYIGDCFGTFDSCESFNLGNENTQYCDGFGIHGYGDTTFINCSGHDNQDDGISHHFGSTGTIIGGEWYNNGKGGVCSPAFGAIVNITGVYCHNNKYGVYILSDATDGRTTKSIVSNSVMKNNTTKDFAITGSSVVIGFNNIYDTKSVGESVSLTEYSN